MDRFEAMRIFCSVIEAGSFASAAERLGLSTTAVSRHVAQLEAHLNVRLINRTTRRMSPTSEGSAYFEQCLQLLANLEEFEASVSGGARPPSGRLRVTAPIAFGILRLAPAFAEFSRRYPEVTLDIVLSDNRSDFAEEGLDMAVRVGRVGGDNLAARLIGEATVVAAASPGYLRKAGVPAVPSDLAHHACLIYSFASVGSHADFVGAGGETVNVRFKGPVHSNNALLLTELAVSGLGVVFAQSFILQSLLEQGKLERILSDWHLLTLPINIVFPTYRHLSAKVRVMGDFLAEWFAKAPADAVTGLPEAAKPS